MRILIPHLGDHNSYLSQLADALGTLGHQAVRMPLRQGLAAGAEVLWIHWPEILGLGVPPAQTALVAFHDLLRDFVQGGGIVAWTVHNLAPHAHPHHPAFRCLYEIVAAHAQIQIHHGQTSVALAGARYRQPHQCIVKVVHHGGYPHLVGSHTQASARAKLGLPPEKKVLLAFGALRWPEELDIILTAAETGWHVLLAGGLPRIPAHLRLAYWLQRRWAGANLTRIRGYIPNADVDAIVKASDALLIARKDALNSGNVYLAMTFGKALIGPDGGNIGEVLAHTGNWRFRGGDLGDLRVVLQRALQADLAPRGAQNAAWLKAHADWDQIAQALLDGVMELSAVRAGR